MFSRPQCPVNVGAGRSAVSRLVRFPSKMIAAITAIRDEGSERWRWRPIGRSGEAALVGIIRFSKTGSSAIILRVKAARDRLTGQKKFLFGSL